MEESTESNVTFRIGNHTISCKKSLLLPYDYFSSLLGTGFREAKQKVIALSEEDVTFKTFETLIQFIKGSKIDINHTNVSALLLAADYFSVDELKKKCLDFIKSQHSQQNRYQFGMYYTETQNIPYVELLEALEKVAPELSSMILQSFQSHFQSGYGNQQSLSFLKEAIEQGYFYAFKALMPFIEVLQSQRGAFAARNLDLDNPVNNQRRLLDIAIEYNRKEMVEILLKHHVCIDYLFSHENGECYTPLSYAVSLQFIEIVKLLVSCYKKNTNLAPQNRNHYGRSIYNTSHSTENTKSALFRAVEGKNREIIELVLEVKSEEIRTGNKTPFHLAFEQGDEDILRLLIAQGADPALEYEKAPSERPSSIFYVQESKTNPSKNNFYHYAALHGLSKKAAFLLDKPEGLSTKNAEGLCPLHIALQKQDDEVVKLFFEVNPYVVDHNNQNILHYIVLGKTNEKYFSLLADENMCKKFFIQDAKGNLPIHYAIAAGNWKATQFLLDRGALDQFIYQKPFLNQDHKTPFDIACDNGMKDFVFKVIRYVCHQRMKQSPKLASKLLYWAAVREYIDIIQYLVIEKKADVNQTSSAGDSFLHWAARSGKLEAVKFLVKHQANVNHQDDQQKTPLHEAAKRGHCKVIKFLLDSHATPSIWDKSGKTPLQLAEQEIESGNPENYLGNYQKTIELLEQAECKIQ